MEPHHLIALIALAVAGFAIWGALARRRRSADAARAYLKGFRYILSDEPSAALAELTRAAKDGRSTETYFALGALFRRTGEHERAIRLHQNMLLKPDLEPRVRQQAHLELALDYQRAGMGEQAMEILEAILKVDPTHRDALVGLRQIYEDQLDYARAASTQGKLVEAGLGSRAILAHLLAEAALSEQDAGLAQDFAMRAVSVDPSSAHAAMALGQVYLKQQRLVDAAAALRRACQIDPEMAPRAAQALQEAMGESPAIKFFEQQLQASDHASIRVALAGRLRQAGRIAEATDHLRGALHLDPRYVEARIELGRTLLESSMGEEARHELQLLLNALGQQEPGFRCKVCGHGYAEPQYRCFACRSWDSVSRCTPKEPTTA